MNLRQEFFQQLLYDFTPEDLQDIIQNPKKYPNECQAVGYFFLEMFLDLWKRDYSEFESMTGFYESSNRNLISLN